ncbi:hypothetical protein B296_00012151 [Ensete ventricosum]|uniref:Uncharacterized protein n=1 Tax=Ensete ventricosum TaxID=4639 RepID=A0A427A3J5_ENSVE|nr:hypothetical protein B296_00012151 [Ensete ventricosum]
MRLNHVESFYAFLLCFAAKAARRRGDQPTRGYRPRCACKGATANGQRAAPSRDDSDIVDEARGIRAFF